MLYGGNFLDTVLERMHTNDNRLQLLRSSSRVLVRRRIGLCTGLQSSHFPVAKFLEYSGVKRIRGLPESLSVVVIVIQYCSSCTM